MSRGYRDLLVWQKSMQLAVEVYRLTSKFPKEEVFGLTSQVRRSAISVPSNIAEGHGRLSKKEFRQFLGVAKGSIYELQTQLELAEKLQMASPGSIQDSIQISQEVGKMIFSLLSSMESSTCSTRADD